MSLYLAAWPDFHQEVSNVWGCNPVPSIHTAVAALTMKKTQAEAPLPSPNFGEGEGTM